MKQTPQDRVLNYNAELKINYDYSGKRFYVASSNVPGLHAEAGELDDLFIILDELIPELIDINQRLTGEQHND